MPLPLIITRPVEQAHIWRAAFQLQLPERVCHVLPLIRLAPVGQPLRQHVLQCWQDLAQFHAVIFVSPAAVEYFFAMQYDAIQRWHQCSARAWAVGPGTQRALSMAGVEATRIDSPPAVSQQFDSEALWPLVQVQLADCVQKGRRILRVCGTDEPVAHSFDGQTDTANQTIGTEPAGNGRNWLSQAIRQAGVQLHSVAAYQRLPPAWSQRQTQIAWVLAQAPAVWLFSSGLAVQNLAACLPDRTWAHAVAVTTHPRIAKQAQTLGFGQVLSARPIIAELVHSVRSCP